MDLKAGTPSGRGRHRSRVHRLLHQRAHRRSARGGPHRRRPQGIDARQRDGGSRLAAGEGAGRDRKAWIASSREAGFDWREPGCSMCLGMNPDILSPGERCASTSNRNFEGRQGRGGRTHLVSPEMAAAAAIAGHFVDIRNWQRARGGNSLDGTISSTLTSLAAPLDRTNVDTDQIIPKQFLKRIERTGYGDFLFFDWRQTPRGDPDSGFRAQRSALQGRADPDRRQELRRADRAASTLPGRSAISDFACVIAPTFADIFFSNAGKNGIRAGRAERRTGRRTAPEGRNDSRTISSPSRFQTQTVTDGQGFKAKFDVDPFRKFCLSKASTISV